MSKTFHIGIGKSLLLRHPHPATLLANFDGDDKAARKAILADPREVFGVPECTNRGPCGECLGHGKGVDV